MEIDNEKLRETYILTNYLLSKKVCPKYNIFGTVCGYDCPYANLCDFITQISDYLIDIGAMTEEEL